MQKQFTLETPVSRILSGGSSNCFVSEL